MQIELINDDHSCPNCYYRYFDSKAYPCSMCVCGEERKDMFKPKIAEQTEPRKTTDYCDDCNHKGCDNCVADSRDDYCIPSNYQKQTEPQTDCPWKKGE